MKRMAMLAGVMRLIGQARVTGALLLIVFMAPIWLAMPAAWPLRTRLSDMCWRLLLASLAVRIHVQGERSDPGQTLIAANHISWLDIAVLARTTRAGFVAKAEVRGWPVLGALAQGWGCQFIDRRSRVAVLGQRRGIEDCLGANGLVLFPEGTTGDGTALLPFRSSLFPEGGGRWRQVQPVALVYRRADGMALTAEERRRVAWIGDDGLLPHVMALAAMGVISGGLRVDLIFAPPFVVENRKQAARESHRAIAVILAAPEGGSESAYAAAMKRVA